MVTQSVVKSVEIDQFLSQHKNVHRNLYPAELVEHSIRRDDTKLASNGAVVGYTARDLDTSPVLPMASRSSAAATTRAAPKFAAAPFSAWAS